MKITITQHFLAAALARGGAVAPKKSAIQILSHVRLFADGTTVAVATTDLDRFAEAHVEANVIEPGAVTVPGVAFVTLIGKHPKEGEVTLETEGESLIVRCGRSKVTLPTIPADQFPAWADEKPVCEFVMGGPAFERTCNRVRFAASDNETQWYLQGIVFDVHDDLLHFAATDGHRLAVSAVPLPEGAEDCPRVIVPVEAIDTTLRIFKGAGEIVISFTDRAVSFTADGLRLSSKLIQGSFPDYRRVIPERGQHAITVKREEFVDCLDRATVLVGEGAYSSIIATPDGDTLHLRSSNQKGGEAEEALSAVIDDGFQRFGFSPRYAAQFLNTLMVDELTIEQGDPGGPHLILSAQAPDFTGVLMPVRVGA